MLRAFKDVGVPQLAGAIGQEVLERRTRATGGRFDRLGGLPLPHAKRLLVVAAAGVQAATCGAVAGSPSAAVLARLRARVGRVVWVGV